MKHFFMMLIFWLGANAWALPTGKIILLRGSGEYNGEKISVGSTIEGSGELRTNSKSVLKMYIEDWGTNIILGPEANMKVDLTTSEVKVKYQFLKGLCRWKGQEKKAGEKIGKGNLFTKTASFGVRGTDYLVITNPLLDESEIIVFEGKVLFENLADKEDQKLVGKGQWGGLGGRFGHTIGAILDLPKNVIDSFNKELNF